MPIEKSELQRRAEEIFKRSRNRLRKPIVIEFSGSPKAGKTTVLSQVHAFLKRIGYRTEVVVERASICPIRDKRHSNFNIWTACETLCQLLEKTQEPPKPDDPEILILDRGLFDATSWLRMMENLARLQRHERESIENFLLLNDWRKRITGVVVMTANPIDSMKRERGYLGVITEEGATRGGSIMNQDVLATFKTTVEGVAKQYERDFDIALFDTSSAKFNDKLSQTCEAVATKVLDWIDGHVQEEILYIPQSKVLSFFSTEKTWLGPTEAKHLVEVFRTEGAFAPRDQVEGDPKLIQALPVVVIRNARGEVLRLRRRERDKSNYLHERLVIWAGGHVREEDKSNGDPILASAVRELSEELRLRISKDDLTLVGALYFQNYGEGTAKHVALAFEWIAKTEDVSVVLSTAEFFERTGGSLSGRFVTVKELRKSPISETEPWSLGLIQSHLTTNKASQGGLFS